LEEFLNSNKLSISDADGVFFLSLLENVKLIILSKVEVLAPELKDKRLRFHSDITGKKKKTVCSLLHLPMSF
jgi:hypothetical protein